MILKFVKKLEETGDQGLTTVHSSLVASWISSFLASRVDVFQDFKDGLRLASCSSLPCTLRPGDEASVSDHALQDRTGYQRTVLQR